MSRPRRANARLGWVFIAPSLLVVVAFFIVPLANSVYIATTDWNGVDLVPRYVGADNFISIAQDGQAWRSLRNNLLWVLAGTIVPIGVGTIVATLLWSGVKGVLGFRMALFMPYVLPPVVVAVIWRWIYDPNSGWVNSGLRAVGLDNLARAWIGDPDTALWAVLLAAIWAATGFAIVIMLAALQNVDTDLVDAARIDGANAGRRLWHVILPQVQAPLIMLTAVFLVLGFNVFDLVFVMTGGGPDRATEVLGTYAFRHAFQFNQVGYGTALALLISAISFPVLIIAGRLQRIANERMEV